MVFRLRSADATFFELFATSARHLTTGAGLLAEMLGEEQNRASVAERMREAEHACDETTHAIVRRVNSTFITPFDREDIYALASGLDDIMDLMEQAVDQVLLYEVKELPADVSAQVEILLQCADLTAGAMAGLRSLKDLAEYWIEINRLENAGDKVFRRIMALLFSGEYKALEVLKLKDVVESLEGAIDGFERVANIVEQIAVKES